MRANNHFDFNQILLGLGTLNRTQLEQIRQRCAFFLQQKHGSAGLEDEDWLLYGILSELSRRGIDNQQTINFRIKKSGSFHSYQTKSERVRMLLEQAAPGLTFTERRALGEVAAKELARFFEKDRKWDITLNRMLERIDLVMPAMDRSFPGYLESGMLGVVLRQMRD